MALELYWGSGSPFAWRVMLTLEVKGLAYQSRLLEFSKGDHKAAGFLKLNPRGKVPLLKDDDFVLNESLAIMAYLDKKYPAPPLFGTSSQETGLIWRAVMETEAYLLSAGDKVIRPVFFGKGLDETEKIQQAAQAVRQELQRIDRELSGSAWLVGKQISAADISLFPLVQTILRAAGKDAAKSLKLELLPLADTFPNLSAWVKRIEALTGYERTYPPHWR
ncbi:MAG TPA: glutathione S-transferase family protein [Candidatus Binatia bacterium]|nr:glutathione S-transferase family protein [Candidatus Binatia bacterium]